jgi:D-glycero-alpha-D-manno-heptose-7-phosphate kinase
VSFVGGGTDLKDFYQKNGIGSVISAAIRKYMYIVIHPYFHDKIRIKYSKTEDVKNIDEIKHPIVRECLQKVRIEKGIEIASFADVPAGTGLGSSSAFTVGLLHALYTYKGHSVTKERLAREACEIEIDILKEPIGKQDQYATSFGNINQINFYKDESVEVSPLLMKQEAIDKFEKIFCLYYTGIDRESRSILSIQKENILTQEKKYNHLLGMLDDVRHFKQMIIEEKTDDLGKILNDTWQKKKKLAKTISNSHIDAMYEEGLLYGAIGGKILGAGGGGFLLLYSKDQEKIKTKSRWNFIDFKIDKEGSKILYYDI